MGERVCKTCIWWKTKSNAYDRDGGMCHLGAPQLPPLEPQTAGSSWRWQDYNGIWPSTKADDFCGEHASRAQTASRSPQVIDGQDDIRGEQ